MIYPHNFEEKIGFSKVRESIRKLCLSSLGKELIDDIAFSTSLRSIDKWLNETKEFMIICEKEENFPTDYFYDVRKSLEKVRIEGTFLETFELFDFKRSLESISAISRFFKDKEEQYPHLIKRCGKIKLYPYISQRLDKIISKHGKIKDNASPELSTIRRDIHVKQSGISRRMHSIMQNAQKEGWADQDVSVSIRDGRMVIPVPSAHKRKINGIVHDESATGKTSYIEPTEIVETNNQIKELEYAEKREIIKILINFCNDIRPYIDDIIPAYDFLAFIDLVRAKALYSRQINAIIPKFENKPIFEWHKAYHPLLFLSHKDENKKVVPLNIQLTEEDRIVLISGPNAGGKSVCLKTVGIIQYMFQCGIPVPLEEESTMGIFNDIFIDIGDEQSLENDLSTYSSHLVNMKNFIKHSGENSLLLIDEFGTGTEPMLGGAIAEAILQKLNNKKTRGVITTHYTNLKHYATANKGIINGAMLYDAHNMNPLFELNIGKPGSSFAFEIAKKIGLPQDVIDNASEKIGSEHIDFDKHLKDIARDKKYWENKRQKIHDNEKKLDKVIDKYEVELKETNKLRKEILEKARKEAEDILKNANKNIEKTIRIIKENQADKEKTKEARKVFEKTKKEVLNIDTTEDNRISRKIEKLKERENKRKEKSINTDNSQEKTKPKEQDTKIQRSDFVKIIKTGNIGEVIEINDKTVIIALGNLMTSVNINKVEKVSSNQAKKQKIYNNKTSSLIQENIYQRKLTFKAELDVRGMRGDEALQTVIEFIDEAIMVSCKRARILHGTGHGILRQIIREYLGTVNLVISAKDESIQMGGSGLTIVEFE